MASQELVAIFLADVSNRLCEKTAQHQSAGVGCRFGVVQLHSTTKFLKGHDAATLDAVETVVGPPVMTSHVECTLQEPAAMDIPETPIRYSTGIEDTADLIADLQGARAGIEASSLFVAQWTH